jgi:hypothetical protein
VINVQRSEALYTSAHGTDANLASHRYRALLTNLSPFSQTPYNPNAHYLSQGRLDLPQWPTLFINFNSAFSQQSV